MRKKIMLGSLFLACALAAGVRITRPVHAARSPRLASPPPSQTFFVLVQDFVSGEQNQNPLNPAKWLDYFINFPGGEDHLMFAAPYAETTVAFQADGQAQNIAYHWDRVPNQWEQYEIWKMDVPFTAVWETVRQGVWDKSYDGSHPDPPMYRMALSTIDAVHYVYYIDSQFANGVQGHIWANNAPIAFHDGDSIRFAVYHNHSNGGHLYLYQNGTIIFTGNLSEDFGDITDGSPGIQVDATQGGTIPKSTDVQILNYSAGYFTEQ